MPAPLVLVGLAAAATWGTSWALNQYSLEDDDLSPSLGKWGDTEIPARPAVGAIGILAAFMAPAAIGAIGVGLAVGAISSATTARQLEVNVEQARKFLADGSYDKVPDWLEEFVQ